MAEIVSTKIKNNHIRAAILALASDNLFIMPSALKVIGEFALIQMRKANAEQIISYGARAARAGAAQEWPALTEKYGKWKAIHYPGRPILVRSGKLFKYAIAGEIADLKIGGGGRNRTGFKLQWDAPAGTTEQGKRDPYGILHQFGHIPGASVGRPIRPWLVMTRLDATKITEFTRDTLVKQIGATLRAAIRK